jgi:hypothetical protein
MFRAFLHLTKEEVDVMTIQDYMDNIIMLKEAMRFRHAPFMNKD